MKEVFIVSAKRTPVGGLLGSLSGFSAPELGALVLKDAIHNVGIDPQWIDSVYMGNVLSAGLGQSPARQAAVFSGIPVDKDATTVNKVCASGMKATAIGVQELRLGLHHVVAVGGMESMSNVPHYAYIRKGTKLGNITFTDGMTRDGLWDVYNDFHMGSAAELGIKKFGFTREQLDEFALSSYRKAQEATDNNKFKDEIVTVRIMKGKEQVSFTRDEDIDKVIPGKIGTLKPAFEKDGLLTAANSSNLNDGAAALILASGEAVKRYNLRPMAKILASADAAQAPEWFTTSPALGIPKALALAHLNISDIDFFEINEAYSSVVLSNAGLLNIDMGKINVYGGAVALGHPIGASGARILVTLLNVLRQEHGKYGVAAICNGGGGATAMVIENLS